jgi:putative oxidoreductase
MTAPTTPVESGSSCIFHRGYQLLIDVAGRFQSPLLLAIRLYWGWHFFLTGKGKLLNPGKVTEFFQSLHIPAFNVFLAGGTECFGGLLLLVGLGSRLISVPLIFVTIVAYLTAEINTVKVIFSDPDKFVSADPFLFMLASMLVLVFGPGSFSMDWLLEKRHASKTKNLQP